MKQITLSCSELFIKYHVHNNSKYFINHHHYVAETILNFCYGKLISESKLLSSLIFTIHSFRVVLFSVMELTLRKSLK